MNDKTFRFLIKKAILMKASDIHIKQGENIFYRVNGEIVKGDYHIDSKDLNIYLKQILDKDEIDKLYSQVDINKTITVENRRLRCNIFLSNKIPSIAMRIIDKEIIDLEKLDICNDILNLLRGLNGLILITGISGSGKTMTLNSIVDYLNRNFSYNILMLEDPIEYLHKSNKSLINQRELESDVRDYSEGLKSALREDPDIIIVGEMRSLDSISIGLTAAETGHLVISTLHTMGVSKTIDRLIDVFPSQQQNQIRLQVSTVLKGVFSQSLVREGDGRKAVFDKLLLDNAVKNLIRENKTHQIDNFNRYNRIASKR